MNITVKAIYQKTNSVGKIVFSPSPPRNLIPLIAAYDPGIHHIINTININIFIVFCF